MEVNCGEMHLEAKYRTQSFSCRCCCNDIPNFMVKLLSHNLISLKIMQSMHGSLLMHDQH